MIMEMPAEAHKQTHNHVHTKQSTHTHTLVVATQLVHVQACFEYIHKHHKCQHLLQAAVLVATFPLHLHQCPLEQCHFIEQRHSETQGLVQLPFCKWVATTTSFPSKHPCNVFVGIAFAGEAGWEGEVTIITPQQTKGSNKKQQQPSNCTNT